jgi:hypothetical protein
MASNSSVVDQSMEGGFVPAGALILKSIQRRYKSKSESRMNRTEYLTLQ